MSLVSDFLKEIDQRWSATGSDKIRLRIIGSTALMLQTGYERATKDSDVLETATLTKEIKDGLLALAGKGTELHRRRNIYLEIVSPGLPFLPQTPAYHLIDDLNRTLRHFEIEVLDTIDVVVSKLKRFSADDVSDITAMVDFGVIDHPKLLDRFRSAVDLYTMDARADELPRYIKNLNRVERDLLFAPESNFELPDWI